MSKHAIVTINIHGSDIELDRISKTTIPRMRSYARSVGADFIEWTELGTAKDRHWKKFDIKHLFKTYDRVLILNVEVMIKDNSKNIFEVIPEDAVGMFNEFSKYPFTATKSFQQSYTKYNYLLGEGDVLPIGGVYWNTGVMLLSSSNYIDILTPPPFIKDTEFHEQDWINFHILYQNKFKPASFFSGHVNVYDIGVEFNCQNPFICRAISKEDIKDASFINVTGINKQSTLKGYQIKLGEDREYFWDRIPVKSENDEQRLAIYTVCFGTDFEKLGNFTLKYMKEYADRIGADFICFDEPPPNGLSSDRFEMFSHVLNLTLKAKELLSTYDRVLHLDADILVLPSSPNIFEIVPEDQFGILEEGKMAPNNIKAFEHYMDMYNDILDELGLPQSEAIDVWDNHYNIGVFVASKCHKNIFVNPIGHVSMVEWKDISDVTQAQHHINFMLSLRGTDIYELPVEFNMMANWNENDFTKRVDGYFLHYSLGNNNKKLTEMRMILSTFMNKYPEYK